MGAPAPEYQPATVGFLNKFSRLKSKPWPEKAADFWQTEEGIRRPSSERRFWVPEG
ncbi:MAG: hypothetical protein GTO26_11655 [Planctomycetales bacterium]|nr:hypothetical protein [Planctomycetales bacterium]